MSEFLTRETNTITVANFWENYLLDKYNFNPAYQRKSVWTEEKQSFFIDSIIRNFPIPPIFLRQHIDDATGKSKYDIIDGKQRLESLVKFIKGEIPVSVELDEAAPLGDPANGIAGAYFKDLEAEPLQEIKRRFWRYSIPIEYLDTDSSELIERVFDRLNRNGEPLQGQELRHSQYHSTELMRVIRECAAVPFWHERLAISEVNRMEDQEFISELIFELLEERPLEADQNILDSLYARYVKEAIDWKVIEDRFLVVTAFLEALNLDYSRLKIGGLSHLYGLWCFSHACIAHNVQPSSVANPLEILFENLRARIQDDNVELYRKSMSFNTRSRAQRARRLEALLKGVGLPPP